MIKPFEKNKEIFIKFLKLPDDERWNRVVDLLNYLMAGEIANKQMLFFLLLGNYHSQYANFVVFRGDSSGGKNHIVKNVLKLFDNSYSHIFDSATAAALNYDTSMNSAKMLYLRELPEKSPILEQIKSMYNEEGKIHYETIQDPETREHFVKKHELKRMGIVTTLSFEFLPVDIINRSWVMIPDQSDPQTESIIDYHSIREADAIDFALLQDQVRKQCFSVAQSIKCLNFKYEVIITYAKEITSLFPTNKLNVRRDLHKLYNFIKIVTIWNQKNRKTLKYAKKDWLFSEFYDLRMALNICRDLFSNTVMHLDTTKRQILNHMSTAAASNVVDNMSHDLLDYGEKPKKKTKKVDILFTVSDVHETLMKGHSINRRTVLRKLNDMYYEGYLDRIKEGNVYQYYKKDKDNLLNLLNMKKLKPIIDGIVSSTYKKYKLLKNNKK